MANDNKAEVSYTSPVGPLETPTLEKVFGLSERLPVTDQLRLIELLVAKVRVQQEQKSEPVDMLSLAGLGADLWRQIDVDDYLDKERDRWDR